MEDKNYKLMFSNYPDVVNFKTNEGNVRKYRIYFSL